MKTPHKHAELIKAWADGAEIEYWSDYRNAWLEICAHPDWMPTTKYRIKPEPKPDVVHDIKVWQSSDQLRKHILHLYNSETRTVGAANLRLTFDGETGKLKKAEVLG